MSMTENGGCCERVGGDSRVFRLSGEAGCPVLMLQWVFSPPRLNAITDLIY